MTIGVGVEGSSEWEFWKKVLHRSFRGVRFDVRNMKTKEKLIRATPQLVDTFRSLHYSAGFILVDRHRDPCTTAVLQRFDDRSHGEARLPTDERYLFICVATLGLESWYLADASAINQLFPMADYAAPEETATLNPKRKLTQLWKEHHGQISALNKIDFAQTMAPLFDPEQGRQRSASFDYFWTRLKTKLQSP